MSGQAEPLEPDFHDGRLLGVSLLSTAALGSKQERTESDTLQLVCSTAGGREYRITVPNLAGLRADNFRQGNIIFEVLLYRGAAPTALLNRVFGHDSEDSSQIPREMDKMTGGWTLIELSSSYGCELVALGAGSVLVDAI